VPPGLAMYVFLMNLAFHKIINENKPGLMGKNSKFKSDYLNYIILKPGKKKDLFISNKYYCKYSFLFYFVNGSWDWWHTPKI
jgi:hypothetical protein